MIPLLPIAFGGILSALIEYFLAPPPRSFAVFGLALGPVGFALAKLAPRAALWVAFVLYAGFLVLAGTGPVSLAPWVLACFGVWLGRDTSWATVRSCARRVLLPLAAVSVFVVALDAVPRGQPQLLAASVLGLFVAAPLVLRLLFPTSRLDLSIEGIPVRLWDLGVPVATASVAGALGVYRTIFVTPELVRVMDPPEGAAVLRHELGHGALGHLRVLALLAAAVLVGFLRFEALGWWLAAPGALLVPGFVLLARRLEHDADLYAAAADGANADAVMSALLKCCAANGQSPTKGGLRHPSVARRIQLLERACREPGFVEARLRRSRRLLDALSALSLLALAAGALDALRDLC